MDKQFLFIGGLHRSGTSLLHKILLSHPAISGFENTGVPEDEGQHLQSVYPVAKALGGAGIFGFNQASFMDENHPLATVENAEKLLGEWSQYWDTSKNYFIEKSPPNLVRTRFLQKLFPNSAFIIILRHPIAVSYATKKWTEKSIPFLIEHTLHCYERFMADSSALNRVYILHYEDFVKQPQEHLKQLLDWVGLPPFEFKETVHPNVNDKYLQQWEADRKSPSRYIFNHFTSLIWKFNNYEKRAKSFGYSLFPPYREQTASD